MFKYILVIWRKQLEDKFTTILSSCKRRVGVDLQVGFADELHWIDPEKNKTKINWISPDFSILLLMEIDFLYHWSVLHKAVVQRR